MKTHLALIMPVYNEQDAIYNVLIKWVATLDTLNTDYKIHVYNDGSKDNSLIIVHGIAAQANGKVVVHDQANRGHGPTILGGYCENSYNSEWIFQTDSDDEMEPEGFRYLWEQRSSYDFLIGKRNGRYQSLLRKMVSLVSRLCVRIFYGKSAWDVNCPYRLMRTEKFRELYHKIPKDTFAPNVIISGFAGKAKLKILEYPVRHRNRRTGEVSIRKWGLLKAALKSFKQVVAFSVRLSCFH